MSKKSSKKPMSPTFDYDSDESGTAIARRGQRYFNEEAERHNKSLYVMLSAALYVLLRMVNLKEWVELCAEDYWMSRIERNRPKHHATDREKATFVALYMFAGKNEIRYDRAWKYGRVIEFCRHEEVEPEDVVEFITDLGGIEKILYDLKVDTGTGSAENDNLPSLAKDAKRDEAIEDREGSPQPEQDGTGASNVSEKPKPTKKGLTISIDLKNSQFAKIINCPLKNEFDIRVIREADRGKYKVFRARRVGDPKKSKR